MLRRISVCTHAASCTPARSLARVARGTAYSNRFPFASSGGLPQDIGGSALATKVSGPQWSSLVLQPARSRDRQAVLSIEGFDGFVSSPVTPIATGWSDPVAGRELHPLKIRAFARRTTSLFFVRCSAENHLAKHSTWPDNQPGEPLLFQLRSGHPRFSQCPQVVLESRNLPHWTGLKHPKRP